MNLFVSALMVTLGIAAAAATAFFLWKFAKFTWRLLRLRTETSHWKMMDQIETQFREERQAENEQDACVALRDPQVAEVVNALREVPYTNRRTRAAQKQRTQRQKLQGQLRDLVPDSGVRVVLHEMAK